MFEAVARDAKDPSRLRECAENIIQYRRERQRWVGMRRRLGIIKDRLLVMKHTAGLVDVTSELNKLTQVMVWTLGSHEGVDTHNSDVLEIKSSELFDNTDSFSTTDESEVDKLVAQLLEAQALKQTVRLPILYGSNTSSKDKVKDTEV